METREVIRCAHCKLNQFMTKNELCRKCECSLRPKHELIPACVMELPNMIEDYPVPMIGALQVRIDLAIMVLRVRLNLTQPQLAAKMGVSRQYICKVERGRCQPWPNTVSRFATSLEVTPYQLIDMATVA